MSSDPGWLRALSGGPLGLAPPAASPSSSPFSTPEPERYADGGLVGVGGMGEVRAAWDHRLGREVALKVSHAVSPGGVDPVEAEAALAATLQHPGIVPIHDAGRTADGRSYYTMRLVQGRSLADAIAASPDLPARLRLVRRLLDACEAVAYAHAEGVVHRDLKPEHIMVGEHGETLVLDWGLAARVGLAAEPLPGAGTPPYRPPEQAAGQPPAPSADVYALGGVLWVVLTGRPPPSHRDVGVLDGVPAELAAVARRARATDPAERYADASALAADLTAWFEGRRVSAYAYSRGELARRAVWSLRAPLAVGALAVVAVAVAVAVGVARTVAERDRAVTAEAAARSAERRAVQHLGRALESQARVASEQGRRAEAEVLAAHALARGAGPEARGILTQTVGLPRPHLRSRAPLPPCRSRVVAPSGGRIACLTDAAVVLLDEQGGDWVPAATLDQSARGAAFGAGGAWLALLTPDRGLVAWRPKDGAEYAVPGPFVAPALFSTGGGEGVFAAERGAAYRLRPGRDPEELAWCGATAGARILAQDARGHPVALCLAQRDARASVVWPGDSAARVVLPSEIGPVTAFAVGPVGLAAVGTEQGLLVLVGPDGAQRSWESGLSGVAALAVSARDVAAVGSEGSVAVFSLSDGALRARLPSGRAQVRWLDGGGTLRVVEDAVRDWILPEEPATTALPSGSGVAGVSLSADGARVASSHGDGTVRVRATRTGAVVSEARWHDSVAKDVALSPDGQRLVAGVARLDGARVLPVGSLGPVVEIPSDRVRRVAWLTDDRVVVASYDERITTQSLPAGPVERWTLPSGALDLEALADRSAALALGSAGDLWRVDAGPPRLVLHAHGARAVAGSVAGLFVAGDGGVQRYSHDGALLRSRALGDALVDDLAADVGGRWLAVGRRDGTLVLLSAPELEPVAVLRGHAGRVASLDFDAAGTTLASGSWDGSVRLWDLSALDADPTAQVAALEQSWGLGLDEALGGAEETP